MTSPSQIIHLAHPSIVTAYIKQDVEADKTGKQILVLETDISSDVTSEIEEDKYFDLLVDLQDIRKKAEKQFGNISRVDIRGYTCH